MIDPQLKRGLLDICVLSALRKGDSYGYQIIKDLSGCIECLTVYTVEHSGRLRKFYRITREGVEQIDQFLAGWPEIERIYAMIKESAEYDARAVSE